MKILFYLTRYRLVQSLQWLSQHIFKSFNHLAVSAAHNAHYKLTLFGAGPKTNLLWSIFRYLIEFFGFTRFSSRYVIRCGWLGWYKWSLIIPDQELQLDFKVHKLWYCMVSFPLLTVLYVLFLMLELFNNVYALNESVTWLIKFECEEPVVFKAHMAYSKVKWHNFF